MPPRLSHRKSRRGCVRCKSRKVKCDEEQPRCGACKRHDVRCEYREAFKQFVPPDSNRATRPSEASPESSHISTTETQVSNGSNGETENDQFDPDARRMLELKLLHYFTFVVGPTLPSSEAKDTADMWSCEAISIALEHSCLLNAIFALAALHCAIGTKRPISGDYIFTETPPSDRVHAGFHSNGTAHKGQTDSSPNTNTSYDWVEIYRYYLNRAIREQRQALQHLSPENIDAIMLTSIIYSQLVLNLASDESEANPEVYSPPIQWLTTTNSIDKVYQFAAEHHCPGDLAIRIKNTSVPPLSDWNEKFNPAYIVPFQAILDFVAPNDDIDYSDPNPDAAMEAYRMTLAYAGGVCLATQRHEHPRLVARRFMGFGPIIPKRYVEMVEERRPRALVILAHFMVNAKYLQHYWFLKGAAERDVYGVKSILPEEWQWAMEWPVRRLMELSDEVAVGEG